MKKKVSILYYLIPVIYVGIILIFVYLQFTSREEFSEKVGNLVVAGISSPRSIIGPREISELEVKVNTLDVRFAKNRPLVVRYTEGREKKLKIKGYASFAEGLELQFSEGFLLRFDLNGSLGDRIVLEAIIPEQFPLSFPGVGWRPPKGFLCSAWTPLKV